MPYASMIGVVTAFGALIPIIGAILGASVGVIIIFAVSPLQAGIFLIFIILLQQLDNRITYPLVVGRSIGLPSVWVFAAVIIGGAKSLWGTLFGTLFVFGLQDLFLMDIPFFVENPAITTIFVGILMILVVMFFPGGFAQIVLLLRVQFYKLKQKWKVRKYGLQD